MRDFPPLTRVAEIGQVKSIIASVLRSGESRFEEGGKGTRSRRTMPGLKVKKGAAPLGVRIDQAIEFRPLGRGLEVAGFQGGIDQPLGEALDFDCCDAGALSRLQPVMREAA